MYRSLRRATLLALVALAPSAAHAQVSTADEGSFTIMRGGARVGREEFRILRQPAAGGTEYVARGLTSYGDRRLTAALQTDAAGAPLRYQLEVKAGAEIEAKLTGQIVHGRFSAQIRTGRGEAASEFAAGDGTVLVDDEIFHQYFFVALATRGGSTSGLSLLAPRRNAQGPVDVSKAGTESLDVGGATIPATRLVLTGPGSSPRTVWVDAGGRVLKVLVPDRGLTALRDDPPAR